MSDNDSVYVTGGPAESLGVDSVSPIRVHQAGKVLTLTLNRPDVLNAMDRPMFQLLVDTLQAAGHDPSIEAIVITGEGRAFSAGADLRMIGSVTDAEYLSLMVLLRELAATIRRLTKPVIAAVNGYAMAGGFELACLCDVRIAARDARFAVGDVEVNLTPTSGLTWLLPRLVGIGSANYLALSGEALDAAAAQRIGLVQEVTEPQELLARSRQLAEHMADLPATARALTKSGIYDSAELTQDEVFDLELKTGQLCFAEAETGVLVRQFLAGRKAATESSSS